MKYLLLLLLLSCTKHPIYKAGECIRIFTNIRVMDFYVREVYGDKYVLSPVFIHDYNGELSVLKEKYPFTFSELDENNSKKISCKEVE